MKIFDNIMDALEFIWKFPIGTCKLMSKGDGSGFIVAFVGHAFKWVVFGLLIDKFVS